MKQADTTYLSENLQRSLIHATLLKINLRRLTDALDDSVIQIALDDG